MSCRLSALACLLLALGGGELLAQNNIALLGIAAQSSQLGGFGPELAIDGNPGNFTHTLAGNNDQGPAIWEVDLTGDAVISQVILRNRADCCGSRLRDVIVSVHDLSFLDDDPIFAVDEEAGEWEWDSAIWQSELLNPENVDGAFPTGPAEIIVDLPDAEGLFVRVTRIPDADLSGSGGEGNNDEATVLSLGEVEVIGTGGFQCPEEGDADFADTRCEVLDIFDPLDVPFGETGTYFVEAIGDDDTGDPVVFIYRAENAITGQLLEQGPTNVGVDFFLTPGEWTITATADDVEGCSDEAVDATCTEEVTIEGGDNLALGKPTAHSSQLGGFGPELAVNGNPGDFTHTQSGNQGLGPAVWEVDLLAESSIQTIEIFNRTSCCGSRLRDIIVSIHDVAFLNDDPIAEVDAENGVWEWDSAIFQSSLLNPENITGAFPLGPPQITVDLAEAVEGQFVRITRIPDDDLSGTGGQGNNDEATVLSLGEVEVYGAPEGCDEEGDTHCDGLTITSGFLIEDGDPGSYNIEASGSDDSGDIVLFTFSLQKDDEEPIVAGPFEQNFLTFTLTEGDWTITCTVDDDRCPDQADDAICVVEKTIGCVGEADTHCEDLLVTGPADGGCGFYELTAIGDDDSGDPIFYTFTADNGLDPVLTVGPQEGNSVLFELPSEGVWELAVRTDDDLLCDDEADDASCRETVEIEFCAENIAPTGIATHSSQLGGFGPELAIDDNLGNFTHTLSGNGGLGPAIWELDLLEDTSISRVELFNRTSCCGSRLRDIIVSIHDLPFTEDAPPLGETADDLPIWEDALFESDLLNPENELGVAPLGPAGLNVDVLREAGEPVIGRYIRVTRLPDPDLSGTDGAGNADEADVLSLGEVRVFACEGDDCGIMPPMGSEFLRGDPDASGAINITDGIFILNFLFLGGDEPSCADAADADDSGGVNITDGIFLLNFLFLGGGPPPAPYPDCGLDGSDDGLSCPDSQGPCA